jgi:hypothetical protein
MLEFALSTVEVNVPIQITRPNLECAAFKIQFAFGSNFAHGVRFRDHFDANFGGIRERELFTMKLKETKG